MHKTNVKCPELIADYVVACRRALHTMPELGAALSETTAFVMGELDAMGIPYTCVERGGIVAEIGSGEHAFLLRADMEALPIVEESGESFASQNGRMHACGHDLHTAMLLGAAKILKAKEDTLPGRVKLVFQYGEEIMEGMRVLVEENGLLDRDKGIGASLALHVMPGGEMEAGSYSCVAGPANTSIDTFHITVHGRGAHGAMQFKSHDPINVGVQIYHSLSNMIGRELDVREGAVLSTCYFIGGSEAVHNIIPDSTVLGGTLRTFSSKVADLVKARIREICESVDKAYHTACTVDFPLSADACINDETVADIVNSCAAQLGMRNKRNKPQLVSDDYSYVSSRIPSCYVWLGAGGKDPKFADGVLHTPNVCFNEEAMPFGAALYADTAEKWLAKKAAENA